jgi:hypothetical protein
LFVSPSLTAIVSICHITLPFLIYCQLRLSLWLSQLFYRQVSSHTHWRNGRTW